MLYADDRCKLGDWMTQAQLRGLSTSCHTYMQRDWHKHAPCIRKSRAVESGDTADTVEIEVDVMRYSYTEGDCFDTKGRQTYDRYRANGENDKKTYSNPAKL